MRHANGYSMKTTKEEYRNRIKKLQKMMKQKGISAYIVPTSDFHNSEYVGDYFKCREFLSGFSGSNGTLVVGEMEVGLWTDGRYYLQAEQELDGTGIQLFRMGEKNVPSVLNYLLDSSYGVIACDGRCIDASYGIRLRTELESAGKRVVFDIDLVGQLWDELGSRPSMSCNGIFFLPERLCGENVTEKINKVRVCMKENGAENWLCSKLDDIAWLLNLRGMDIECNPVFLSYLYLTMNECHLYVQKEAVGEIADYLNSYCIVVHNYEEIDALDVGNNILIDFDNCSMHLLELVPSNINVIQCVNPTLELKAIKTEVELEAIRKAYILDSVALTDYIFWLKSCAKYSRENRCEYVEDIYSNASLGKGDYPQVDEIYAADVLDNMRKKIPGFIDLSFPTISAYGTNAAIVHYEASNDTSKKLKPEGLYLVDSGGQYMYEGNPLTKDSYAATTDVTRTVALGNVSDEMKRDFTLVLIGMLRMQATVFKDGCTGRNLDIVAREALWECGLDYRHGTGHGIGYVLNVHEGPQNIGYKYLDGRKEYNLKPGMIVSDEPGFYSDGKYGIRTENIIEITEKYTNEYGTFMGSEFLTWVPIDLDVVDSSVMSQNDIELLNKYHSRVFEIISPYIKNKDELDWLRSATRVLPQSVK